ncbi:MAG: hypothetical protein ACM3PP_04485, partial [Candidatus Saccharibacteria bacterium]
MNDNGTFDYEDFLNAYGKYSRLQDNSTAREVFELLSDLNNIQKMIWASDAGQPALSTTVVELEEKFGEQTEFDLANDLNKQAVGAMIKIILQPFGYESVKPRLLRAGLSKYFRSAPVFRM